MQIEKIEQNLTRGWMFRQVGQHDWYPATVPGCNFTDLLNNNLIPDPFYADNESKLQWIEHEDWEYQSTFELSKEEIQSRQWHLDFAGLDTYCDIYLNDSLLVSSDNMFVPLTVDCHGVLKPGDNRLRIYFHSPIRRTRPLFERNGYVYPAENDKSEDRLSVYSRKAPYHFGWDWGPRFVTCGIWKSVKLVGVQKAYIQDVQNTVVSLNAELATIDFVLTANAQLSDNFELSVDCDNAPMSDVKVSFKDNQAHLQVSIMAPKLWWPNGLGDAFLYRFQLSLKQGDRILDLIQTRVGLRTIEMVNEIDSDGLSFYFKVNGHPVFIKGANYIPGDSFLNRVEAKNHQQTMADAVSANMNMLRVWGGGVYQDDTFYDLADENGIMVWQDFMFACSLYPGDDAFVTNVAQEAKANILRLRNHPCIAMWCGNNEIEMGISDWQWQKKFNYDGPLQKKLQSEYDRVFRQLLPAIVAELDGERFYLSSSPIGYWEHPEQDNKGNHHYWGVWHGEQPFSEYRRRIPRFMSEYGFQSFPLMQSVEQYIPEPERQLDSVSMKVHQKHPRGNGLIKKYMLDEYKEPKDFASLLYLSQVQQAWGLKQAFDAHRLNKPYCMGTIYWQFNDCWPVASWSGIDYYGRWKALHYQAKRSFKPIIPVIECKAEDIQIYVVNDTLSCHLLTLTWRLLSFSGETLKSGSYAIDVNANASDCHLKLNKSELIADIDRNQVVLVAELLDTRRNAKARDTYYFVPNKEMALQATEVSVHMSEQVKGALCLQAGSLVKDMHIDLDGIQVNFSDNFFDLLPNEEKLITLPDDFNISALSQGQLCEKIRITSVVDTWSKESN